MVLTLVCTHVRAPNCLLFHLNSMSAPPRYCSHQYTLTGTVHTSTHSLVLFTPVHTHWYCSHQYTLTGTVHTSTHSLVLFTPAHTHWYCSHQYTLTGTVHTSTHSLVLFTPVHTHWYCSHQYTLTGTVHTSTHSLVLFTPVHTHWSLLVYEASGQYDTCATSLSSLYYMTLCFMTSKAVRVCSYNTGGAKPCFKV